MISDNLPTSLKYMLVGSFTRDFIIATDGRAHIDIPGGSLFHSAAAVKFWDQGIGLVGKIGKDYPTEWLQHLVKEGFCMQGIKTLAKNLDHRSFQYYPDADNCVRDNPINHFLHISVPFPKQLVGYSFSKPVPDKRNQTSSLSILASDIPTLYMDCTAAHLCPLDYISHIALTEHLRKGLINTLTLDPSHGYMDPTFMNVIPPLVKGLTAFISNQEKMSGLFRWSTSDLWEMAEEIAGFGCEIVVIKRGAQGQYVFDRCGNHKWVVPAYPARVVDPTGAGDVFCGAYLAGYRQYYDPLLACLMGNVTASLAIEGSGPFFLLNALPGLAQMRLDILKDKVTQV